MSPLNPGQLPHLLHLPLELRQHIYTYLLPATPLSHPLPSVGLTSTSHRPPPLNLLLIHRTLTSELLDTFYEHTSFKVIFSHAFNFFRVDPFLHNLENHRILTKLRKVELVFFCDILLLRDYPSFGLELFCAEILRRAERACEVLAQAERLRSVTVSWIDTTLTEGWEQKAKVLKPLSRLAVGESEVMFRVGEVIGPEDVNRKKFVRALRQVVGENRRVRFSSDGMEEEREPHRLRMLAFDPRQERGRSEAAKAEQVHTS